MMTFSAFIIIFFAEKLISAHTHDNPSTKLIGQEQQQKVKGINYGGRFIPENWMQLDGMKDMLMLVLSQLKVLLVLHGAPGGQSTNQYTGCATSCQNPIEEGCDAKKFYFQDEQNEEIALNALKEMAEICKENVEACYGIELLHEPSPEMGPAIELTDLILPPEAAFVLMDFPWWMGTFWSSHFGGLQKELDTIRHRVEWETHIYPVYSVLKEAKSKTHLQIIVEEQFILVEPFRMLFVDTNIF
ncbi:hypothetical protein TrLO_g14784 [Triparma laevis f. longispina]|uniref:Uncharacterized protein n=1 Tax=Triparma laevis f. longispina TaxID=1714387 RepID=A0A9W6ZGI2_9STRA|nr:hypothetical protein TrLO_g14784 [Triparma laevis f. longispina]